ncbi:hypothetical protein [Corynebacterium epidermidicanis]|uniref:Secreted protein n=1 Tax=Corynebacterium epidermidicanis TaxID=1050174 RepID=A0A0G3GP21_9CORY|nr:hypothetical protein [Corynebacterium epidermidicanis]AKK02899.1 hypothetical protein CEPID_05150 [Corynebacterium epidermidicanis]
MNRRFASVALAFATAISLSTGVATAETSSDVTDAEAGWYVTKEIVKGNVVSSSGSSDSIDKTGKVDPIKVIGSSLKNDTANGYPVGQTIQIIAGFGIAGVVAILALAAHGAADLISKAPLPRF